MTEAASESSGGNVEIVKEESSSLTSITEVDDTSPCLTSMTDVEVPTVNGESDVATDLKSNEGEQQQRSLEALLKVTDSELQNLEAPPAGISIFSITNNGGETIQLSEESLRHHGLQIIYENEPPLTEEEASNEVRWHTCLDETTGETVLVYEGVADDILQTDDSISSPQSGTHSTNIDTDTPKNDMLPATSTSKPGRHICPYCSRACAKPSVLEKHIRAHTGERPYPCVPCGFSFKTKSNLYKHCKSRTHAIKLAHLHAVEGKKGHTEEELCYIKSMDSASGYDYATYVAMNKELPENKPSVVTNEEPDTEVETDDSTLRKEVSTSKTKVDEVYQIVGVSKENEGKTYNVKLPDGSNVPMILCKAVSSNKNLRLVTRSSQSVEVDNEDRKSSIIVMDSESEMSPIVDKFKAANEKNYSIKNIESCSEKGKDLKSMTPDMLSRRINDLINKNSAILDTPMADRPRPKRLSRQNSEVRVTSLPIDITLPGSGDNPLTKKYTVLAEKLNTRPILNVWNSELLGDDGEVQKISFDQSMQTVSSTLIEGLVTQNDASDRNCDTDTPQELKIQFKLPQTDSEVVPSVKAFLQRADSTPLQKREKHHPLLKSCSVPAFLSTSATKPKPIRPKVDINCTNKVTEAEAVSPSFAQTTPPEWKMILKGKLLMKRSMSVDRLGSGDKPMDDDSVVSSVSVDKSDPVSISQVEHSVCSETNEVVAPPVGDSKVISKPATYLNLIPPQLLESSSLDINEDWTSYGKVNQPVYTSASSIYSPILPGNQQLFRLPMLGRKLPPLALSIDTLTKLKFHKSNVGKINTDSLVPKVDVDLQELNSVECTTVNSNEKNDKQSTNPTFCTTSGTQPMYVMQKSRKRLSMYSNWRIASHNPNPMGLSSRAMLSLYSTNNKSEILNYVNASSDSPEKNGLLTHSSYWTGTSTLSTQETDNKDSGRSCEDQSLETNLLKNAESMPDFVVGSEVIVTTENRRPKRPTTVVEIESIDDQNSNKSKRFCVTNIGGYKSEEDYVYIRGRGRGKYVCQQCGIRCRKPSMLKKHVRTHTDFRPYRCRQCHFSFKTKGNLTKHMKSKTHYKRCLEIGAFPVPTSVEESQIDSQILEQQVWWSRQSSIVSADGDSIDFDDDEDDDVDDEDDNDDIDEDTIASNSLKEIIVTTATEPGTSDRPVYVAIQSSSSTGQPEFAKIAIEEAKEHRLSTIYGYKALEDVEQTIDSVKQNIKPGQLNKKTTGKSCDKNTDREIACSLLDLSKRGEAGGTPKTSTSSSEDDGDEGDDDDLKGNSNRLNILIGALKSRTGSELDAEQAESIVSPSINSQENASQVKLSKSLLDTEGSASKDQTFTGDSGYGRRTYAQKIAALQDAYEKDLQTYLSGRPTNMTSSGFIPPSLLSPTIVTVSSGSGLPQLSPNFGEISSELLNDGDTNAKKTHTVPTKTFSTGYFAPIVKQAQSLPSQVRFMSSPKKAAENKKRKLISDNDSDLKSFKRHNSNDVKESFDNSGILPTQKLKLTLVNGKPVLSIDNSIASTSPGQHFTKLPTEVKNVSKTVAPEVKTVTLRTAYGPAVVKQPKVLLAASAAPVVHTSKSLKSTVLLKKESIASSAFVQKTSTVFCLNSQPLGANSHRISPYVSASQLSIPNADEKSAPPVVENENLNEQHNVSISNPADSIAVSPLINTSTMSSAPTRLVSLAFLPSGISVLVETSSLTPESVSSANNETTVNKYVNVPEKIASVSATPAASINIVQQQAISVQPDCREYGKYIDLRGTGFHSLSGSGDGVKRTGVQPVPAQGYIDDIPVPDVVFADRKEKKNRCKSPNESDSLRKTPNESDSLPDSENQDKSEKQFNVNDKESLPKLPSLNSEIAANKNNNVTYVEGEKSAPFEIVPTPGKVEDNSKSLKDGRYVCHLCDRKFNQEYQLNLHKKIHLFERPYRCIECNISFRTFGLLQRHRRSEVHASKATVNMQYGIPTSDNPRPYRCDDCNMGFRIHGHLAKHLRSKLHVMTVAKDLRHHDDGEVPETDTSSVSMVESQDGQSFMCHQCKTEYVTFRSYTRHLRSKQHLTNTGCEVQSKDNSDSIENHLLEDDESASDSSDGAITLSAEETACLSKCDTCNTAYREKELLDKHLKSKLHIETMKLLTQPGGGNDDVTSAECPNVGGATRQKCGLCGLSFSSIQQLKQHLASHAELRPYVCQYCDAGFTNAEALQTHQRIHEKELPFTCGHCGATFSQSDALKQHFEVHHDVNCDS